MITAIASIFVFGLMIVFHEFGHFATAKLAGVRVLEFSIGMGPKLFGMRRGDTLYSLRMLPLGGFVRMAGMDAEEGRDIESLRHDPENFNNKTVWKRAVIIAAGSIMNFILAFLLFLYIFMIIGVPAFSNVIGDVVPGKPAQQAGILPGDRIVAANDKTVQKWSDLIAEIHPNAGKQIVLKVDRQGQIREVPVTPLMDEQRKVGQLGIMADEDSMFMQRQGVFESLRMGIVNTIGITGLIIRSLLDMIAGTVPADVGGPVMIVSEIGKAAQTGLSNLLMLAAVLSINLGVLNLFPIPALDGSRLVFLGLEALRGRPIDPAKENMIHLAGFALLMAFMVFIAYNDIVRLLGGM
ncbi:RIP metalloprotease RseP [Heliophilum fasciatum]|uniref:Zinc metalloprotease n=1 Tax=Heliophilum fasciatum TaxID=35700 RepID=A0A4V2SX41_9FIRM|nr:RIP metalloprotease RseP [Heliophilum fasciatum]MCW2277904.1 regulator of sigma E protease [Heliophilum fasciatum]TCP64526.1 site-2 protease [Heliophilum fasciatum]